MMCSASDHRRFVPSRSPRHLCGLPSSFRHSLGRQLHLRPSVCCMMGILGVTSVILCWRKDGAVGEMRRRRKWGIVWWLDARGLGCMFRGCPSSIWVAERDYRSTFTGDDDVRPDVASPVYGSCHVRPVSSQTLWRAQGCWVRRPS